MKKARGYIFSRSFLGERVPQSIQNLAIRDFCERNHIIYQLSATEYAMENSSKVLFKLARDKKENNIVLYSLFQLPSFALERSKFYKIVLKQKKNIYFALENKSLISRNDIELIENIWNIKNTLPYCLLTW